MSEQSMVKFIASRIKELNPAERRQFFASQADEVHKEQKVIRQIHDEKRQELKDKLTETYLKLQRLLDEYDEVKSEWKEKLDPFKKDVKELSSILNTGYEELIDDKFLIRDQEEGKVYTYLSNGQLIDSRRMFEHERQTTIQNIKNAQ